MQEPAKESHWQVTCPCGWRTNGTREQVVAATQEHGRVNHLQEPSEPQVMDLAVEVPD